VCCLFDVECGALTHYVEHRPEVLQKYMDDMGHTRERANEAFQIPPTISQIMRGVKNEFHKRYDVECKRIQQELMKVPELQWMLEHCKEDNRAGSFISHLYQFIESKLVMAVASCAAAPVYGYIYDGLNLADKSLFNTQPPLDEAHAICEEIAPGINALMKHELPRFTRPQGRVVDSTSPPSTRSPRSPSPDPRTSKFSHDGTSYVGCWCGRREAKWSTPLYSRTTSGTAVGTCRRCTTSASVICRGWRLPASSTVHCVS
jgi:hypothetical protein